MRRTKASHGFVTVGALTIALLAGCSDDVKPKNDKSSVDSAKLIAKSSDAGPAPRLSRTGSVEPKEIPKEPVKPDATPQLTTDVKPAIKAELRPPEGKVEVKADPDPAPAIESKPEAKSDATPAAITEPKTMPLIDLKPAMKAEPKPPEGKVEVKADPDPDPDPAIEAKPDSKPDIKKEASPTSTSANEDNAAPKISTFASADDLAAELKILVGDVDKATVSEEEYKGQVEGRFARDGNTIALIAIALGLHDQDSLMKANAKAIAAAAGKLTKANDFAATTQAVADLKAAVAGKAATGDELKWTKVTTLNNLMKDEVPNINKKLNDSLRHFKKRSAETAANAATMALVAQNAKLYLGDTDKPSEGAKWTEFTDQMRTSASELAAKAHAGDEAGAKTAMGKLNQSCHDCHAVFNPERT